MEKQLELITAETPHDLSNRGLTWWRIAQTVAWAAGMFIWFCLIFRPELGLHLLWNVLIPLAPILLVIAPGVWRNVCPLASMSLAPHHFGYSRKKKLSTVWRARFFFGALILLFVVVPLRKVILDSNGPLLAIVLALVGVIAIGLGAIFKWKSGWCSSLCPVYPVELLYGSRPLVSVPNAHCSTCLACVAPCSESTARLTPANAVNTRLGRWIGWVFIGCFPGLVWGWYQVPTFVDWEGFRHLHVAYGIPYASAVCTLVIFFALRQVWPRHPALIASVFAAAAIITYYWFRLPPVFGIGDPKAAMIVDLSPWLPEWSAIVIRVSTIVFFVWLMIGRKSVRRAWETRPAVLENSVFA